MECSKHGRVRVAEHLDHIIPLSKGGRDEATNRQGLCRQCHDEKTTKDLGFKKKRKRFNTSGEPIDAHGNPTEW